MRRRSLRLRLLAIFGLGALTLSSLFAVLTYVGVSRVLIHDQESTDLRQAFVNAALIRSTLYTSPPDLPRLLNSIERATTSNVLVRTHNQWLSRSREAVASDVSSAVLDQVGTGHAVTETLSTGDGVIFVVGVPIPAVETQVYEVFRLAPLEHTLRVLMFLVGAGALVTSVVGLTGGLWVARRTVAPLERTAAAAALIAEGELATRLDTGPADREVFQLAESFNSMVARLVERLERDARFASDVSHELRSPLTTLATTASVLVQHREELSAPARASLDLLVADLAIFQGLVEDLLEIARSDAGATSMVIESVDPVELVRQSVRRSASRYGLEAPPVMADPALAEVEVAVDRRRFERVIANLLDNAARYASGAVAVRLTRLDDHVAIDVDDAGSGIAPEEREAVFERFFRGRAAHARGSARGTGLGLALVRDHVSSLGGTIQVATSPEGGARLRVTLPLHEVRT